MIYLYIRKLVKNENIKTVSTKRTTTNSSIKNFSNYSHKKIQRKRADENGAEERLVAVHLRRILHRGGVHRLPRILHHRLALDDEDRRAERHRVHPLLLVGEKTTIFVI